MLEDMALVYFSKASSSIRLFLSLVVNIKFLIIYYKTNSLKVFYISC